MPLAVEEDEPPHPVDVGILCPQAVMPDPQALPQLVQKPRGWRRLPSDPLPTRLPIHLKHGLHSATLRSPIPLRSDHTFSWKMQATVQSIVFFSPVKAPPQVRPINPYRTHPPTPTPPPPPNPTPPPPPPPTSKHHPP